MASEVLKLTAQIVISHASMSELSSNDLIEEIKEVYNTVALLEGETALLKAAPVIGKEEETKPPIRLKDIVKDKYVVCLECGKKLRSLKVHIRKAHNLMPKEYFKRYDLDPKTVPLVCKESSEQRRKLAIRIGLGSQGRNRSDMVAKL